MKNLLFWVMIAAALCAGVAVQASEPVQCLDAPAAQNGAHFAGDLDDAPADDRDAGPHHHGSCSGHSYGAPPVINLVGHSPASATVFALSERAGLNAYPPDRAIRPPIA